MRRWLRRLLLIGLAALVLAAGLSAAAWLAFRAYAPDVTRERLEAALTEALGAPVRIAEVRLDPWLGRLALSGITVASPADPARPQLRLGRITIRVGVSSLWQRELVISRILLEDLALRLAPAGEKAPLASLAIPRRIPLGPVTASLHRIELRRGTLTYDDPRAGAEVELLGLEGSAEVAADRLGIRLRAETLRLKRGTVGQALDSLDAEGDLLADRLAIRRLRGRWKGRALSLAGELFPLRDPVAVSLRVQGEVDLAEAARTAGIALAVSGIAGARGEVSGDLDAPRITAQITVPLLTAGPLAARAVRLRGRWAAGTLRLEEFEARLLDGEASGALTMTPARPAETRLRLALRRVDIPALERMLDRPIGLAGRLSGEADLTGDLGHPERLAGRLRLEAASLALPPPYDRLGTGTVSAEGTLEQGGLALERATARWADVDLAARGGIHAAGPRALRVEGRLDLGRLAPRWNRRDLAGHVDIAVLVDGGWEGPAVSGRIRSGDLAAFGTRLDETDIPFRFAGSGLEAEPSLRLGRIRLTASGRLDWPAPLPPGGLEPTRDLRFQAAFTAPEVPWEDLAAWLPEPARGQGRFSLSGTVSGTPGSWRGAARLQAATLTGPHDVPIRDLAATLEADGGRILVRRLQASLHAVPLQARGQWAWDGRGELSAEIGPAELARLPHELARSWLRGSARAGLQVKTGPASLEASGSITLAEAAVRDLPLGPGRIEATLRQNDLRARVDLPDLRITGTLATRLDAAEPVGVHLQATEMALAPIIRALAPPGTMPIEGVLTAVADLSVPRSDPAKLRGTLTAESLRFSLAGDTWENQGPVRLRWESGRLAVERLALASRLGAASAAGFLEPGGSLELDLRSRIPLAILPGLVPAVREAAGSLEARLQLGGSTSAPILAGRGVLRSERILLRDMPDPLRDVEAAFEVSPEALRISRATATLGRSRLRASGDLLLDGWRPGPYRLDLIAREVPFAPLDGLSMLWDLDLELFGEGSAARIRGQGRLLRGSYTGDFSLLGMLLGGRAGSGSAAPPVALPIQLRLQLDDNLAIRTNLAQLRIGGALTVEGTTAAPVLFGTLESRGGRITFRRNRFIVERASARFSDPVEIDPILSLTGRAKIDAYDVVLTLGGSSRNLIIRLASTPPLSQEEIVALITTGTPHLKSGQAAQGLLAEELGQILVQDVLGVVTDSAGLGRIQAGVIDEEDRKRLQVGTQLTEDVRVLYWQTISGGSKRLMRVEYQLLGPLLIAGEQDFEGGYGGDLLLRLRFR